jgi:DNA-binding response OmpR family regulator
MNKSNPTILVVEDEKSLLKAWAEIFKREGFNVLTASDGSSALNLALRWRPDLLVVDLVMSLELIKKLRESKWGEKVPVMFLSGWLGTEISEHEAEEKSQDQDHYFHDNWNFDQVVREVRNKLKFAQFHGAS